MKKGIFLLLAAFVVGYLYFGFPLPSSHTNDTRFAYVFANEGLGDAPCIHYSERTREELSIPVESVKGEAPGQLTSSRFDSEEVHRVAPTLADGTFDLVKPEIEGIQVGSNNDEDWCGSSVSPIIVVDDVAIVRFSSPGGAIGAHVFHRGIFGWRQIERVQTGWW